MRSQEFIAHIGMWGLSCTTVAMAGTTCIDGKKRLELNPACLGHILMEYPEWIGGDEYSDDTSNEC